MPFACPYFPFYNLFLHYKALMTVVVDTSGSDDTSPRTYGP